MIFLRALRKVIDTMDMNAYPLSIPFLMNMDRLEFTKPVTVIAGENGTGKTSLLEILALKLNAVRIDGSNSIVNQRAVKIKNAELSFKLETQQWPRRNFFLQAEQPDYYIHPFTSFDSISGCLCTGRAVVHSVFMI